MADVNSNPNPTPAPPTGTCSCELKKVRPLTEFRCTTATSGAGSKQYLSCLDNSQCHIKVNAVITNDMPNLEATSSAGTDKPAVLSHPDVILKDLQEILHTPPPIPKTLPKTPNT